MSLEERERAMRDHGSSDFSFGGPAAPSEPTNFQRVAASLIIDRLLDSETSAEFFRQPPFSLSEHAAPQTLDAAYKRAGRMVHPDKCRHPRATEAFQRLAQFRAVGLAAHQHQTAGPLTRRDKCEECGKAVQRASDLFVCDGCGRRACHACNFGLVDKTGAGPHGDRHCYACVWLHSDLHLEGSVGSDMAAAQEAAQQR